MQAPELPPPVPVTLDPKATALLVLDISDVTTKNVPACAESVPAVRRLIDSARAAGAKVVFALGRAAEQKIAAELDPRPDDPVVRTSADKFFGTDLDKHVAGRTHAVIVGTAANGAVLYTALGACARGLTVVVAEDGISSRDAFATYLARYQVLNQPGFPNAQNIPLQPKAVTLSRSDLIGYASKG